MCGGSCSGTDKAHLSGFVAMEEQAEPKDNAVNEYLRKFNKRKETQSQSKIAASYGISLILFLLFATAIGVVIFGA